MQTGHGKLAPLKRVAHGDRVVYYAPTTVFESGEKLQRFVSVGIVQGAEPYAFDMGDGFVPWRRDVCYVPAQETPILALLDQLNFIEDSKRWGYKFRFGLFEIDDHDLRLIARAMNASTDALDL